MSADNRTWLKIDDSPLEFVFPLSASATAWLSVSGRLDTEDVDTLRACLAIASKVLHKTATKEASRTLPDPDWSGTLGRQNLTRVWPEGRGKVDGVSVRQYRRQRTGQR